MARGSKQVPLMTEKDVTSPADVRIANPRPMPKINVQGITSALGTRIPQVNMQRKQTDFSGIFKAGASLIAMGQKMEEAKSAERVQTAVMQAQQVLGTAQIKLLNDESIDGNQLHTAYDEQAQAALEQFGGELSPGERRVFEKQMVKYNINAGFKMLEHGIMRQKQQVKSTIGTMIENIKNEAQAFDHEQVAFQTAALDKYLASQKAAGLISEDDVQVAMQSLQRGLDEDYVANLIGGDTPQLAVKLLDEGFMDRWWDEDKVQIAKRKALTAVKSANERDTKMVNEQLEIGLAEIKMGGNEEEVAARLAPYMADMHPVDQRKFTRRLLGAVLYRDAGDHFYSKNFEDSYAFYQAQRGELLTSDLDPLTKEEMLKSIDSAWQDSTNAKNGNGWHVASRSPVFQQAMAEAGDDPAAIGRAYAYNVQEQERLGITNIQYLPPEIMNERAQAINGGKGEDAIKNFYEMLTVYPHLNQEILKDELVKAGVNPERAIIFEYYAASPEVLRQYGDMLDTLKDTAVPKEDLSAAQESIDDIFSARREHASVNGALIEWEDTERNVLAEFLARADVRGVGSDARAILEAMAATHNYSDGGSLYLPQGVTQLDVSRAQNVLFRPEVAKDVITTQMALPSNSWMQNDWEGREQALEEMFTEQGYLRNAPGGKWNIVIPLITQTGIVEHYVVRDRSGRPLVIDPRDLDGSLQLYGLKEVVPLIGEPPSKPAPSVGLDFSNQLKRHSEKTQQRLKVGNAP